MTKGRRGAGLAAAVMLAVLPATLLVAPAASAAEASPRVVNGREPVAEEISALVLVQSSGSLCSGTLVDSQHVITAAHCVANADASTRSPAAVRVGWSATAERPPAVHAVSAVHVSGYSGAPNYFNDIAVLKLTRPIPGATPLPLTSAAESRRLLAGGRPVLTAGYGATTPDGGASSFAYVGNLRALPNSVCGQQDGTYELEGVTFYSPWIYEVMVNVRTAVCAVGVIPGSNRIIDACSGDSGGPLMGATGVRQRLVGVVSVGVGCAGVDEGEELEYKVPGIYTRIAPYLEWLTGLGIETIPEPPGIIATPVGPDGIDIAFTGASSTPSQEYLAVVSGDEGTKECRAASGQPQCVVTGLIPGNTYSVVGLLRGTAYQSRESDAIAVVAGVPSVRPSKPRIDSAKTTPSRRLAVIVSRIDPAGWTSTFVVCNAGGRTYRADVVAGKAVLALPSGATYRCYAKSTNDVGGTRSKPIRVEF